VQRDSTKVLDQPPRTARNEIIGSGEGRDRKSPKYHGYVHHPASADAALFLKSSVPAWNLFGRGEPNPKLDTERGRQHGAEIANAARSGLVNFICHHQFG
jgi:hypothetical protein